MIIYQVYQKALFTNVLLATFTRQKDCMIICYSSHSAARLKAEFLKWIREHSPYAESQICVNRKFEIWFQTGTGVDFISKNHMITRMCAKSGVVLVEYGLENQLTKEQKTEIAVRSTLL
jgi:hypothetical protein